MAVKGSFATAHRPGFTAPETWIPGPGLQGLPVDPKTYRFKGSTL